MLLLPRQRGRAGFMLHGDETIGGSLRDFSPEPAWFILTV
ncbi:hypothetical protein HNR55_003080 [Acetobacter lovaniensis]|uniref:Uncharacterized protein n=1 Tax=Acetobacter lovaniensis TaxID=104100 RepID=A0A841QIQ1_9PROT|nr:hypothetical protein [Acetobacter lovaniensis]